MNVVVDAHQHFWDPSRAEYSWMTGDLSAIRRPFRPDDLRPLLDANGIDYTVLVQTRASVDETIEFLAVADGNDFVAGVVGWADLMAPDLPETLVELRQRPGGGHLVGIRHQVHDEEDPQWLLRPDVRRGLEAVAGAGLVYDLLVRPRELPAASTIARDMPDLTFVIDHIAKPAIAHSQDTAWQEGMAPFAELPNVHCKLSGLVTEADWADWTPDQLAPFVSRVRRWFGDQRLLFGSDWPVCTLAADYGRVLAALLHALGDLSPETRSAILGDNASRVYSLPGVTRPRIAKTGGRRGRGAEPGE